VSAVDELVAAATVGLAVREVEFETWPPELRPAAAAPGADEQETAAAVLDAAALVTAAQRAQSVLAQDLWPIPDPPGEEPQRVLSPAATGALRQLLSANPTTLVAAVKIVADRGAALPVRELPELANKAISPGSGLRSLLAAAAGPTGRWLLNQNPRWRGLLAAERVKGPAVPTEADWLHGSPARRLAWLEEQRRADPAAGREALAAVWPQQKVDDKTNLLPGLMVGLGPDDVPFLETARKDRSKTVADVAIGLLAHIPTGAFADRRAALIREHFTVRKPFLGKPKLNVTELEADPGDGIPQGAEKGVLALITATPLPLWQAVLGHDPVDLAAMAQDGVSFDAASAFFRAAVQQGDSALMARLFTMAADPWQSVTPADVELLPYNVRIDLARQTLAGAGESGAYLVRSWLGSPLPAAILDDVLAAAAEHPESLAKPEMAAALTACSPAQIAKIRTISDQLADARKFAASRMLADLTLLIRLDQELS